MWLSCGWSGHGFGMVCREFLDCFDLGGHECKVVSYNYVLCWLYSITKSIVIALILFFVFCGILLYWV